ncbi:hypothetical protein B296_00029118 [Ensete ventricosum]|uniref:Uncharacterized protein n=1 Tax=Ensete ventricosum TaxID=4639 RepID=A0A426ZZC5_ENSVE|nr:hypothetical protein B296_00029118 [Ensete ventricosum]
MPPCLPNEEFELTEKLRVILHNSRVIKDMIEAWLVEAGFSPVPRGMVCVVVTSLLPSFDLVDWPFSFCHCKHGRPVEDKGWVREPPYELAYADVEGENSDRSGQEASDRESFVQLERTKVIAEYKVSWGFEFGIERTRRITYEFGYRVALEHFQAKYSNLSVEEDSFAY